MGYQLGPIASGDDPHPDGTPVSRALRRLGVGRQDGRDEFEVVGLGRHRRTEDWLPEDLRPDDDEDSRDDGGRMLSP